METLLGEKTLSYLFIFLLFEIFFTYYIITHEYEISDLRDMWEPTHSSTLPNKSTTSTAIRKHPSTRGTNLQSITDIHVQGTTHSKMDLQTPIYLDALTPMFFFGTYLKEDTTPWSSKAPLSLKSPTFETLVYLL